MVARYSLCIDKQEEAKWIYLFKTYLSILNETRRRNFERKKMQRIECQNRISPFMCRFTNGMLNRK